MSYFQITNSLEKKVIGKFPQVLYPGDSVNVSDPDYIDRYLFQPVHSNTLVPDCVLAKGAKITDLLSCVFLAGELLVSDKLKELLAKSNCYGVEFVPTKLITLDKKEIPFWFVHPVKSNFDIIDFPQSHIVFTDSLLNESSDRIEVTSSKEFQEMLDENKKEVLHSSLNDKRPLVILNAVFKQSETDFFVVTPFKSKVIRFYISEKLKELLIQNEVTGMEFID